MVQSSYNNEDASEHHGHREPIFWGTSEILEFPSDQCITAALEVMLKKTSIDPGTRTLFKEKMDAADTGIAFRALYGFFPTITEHDKIVVLDPSDFHTERLSIALEVLPDEFKNFIARCNPYGDLITFCAVVNGDNYSKLTEVTRTLFESTQTDEFSGIFVPTVRSIVEKRITTEIRKALALPGSHGDIYNLSAMLCKWSHCDTLFELMSFEERLGIYLDGNRNLQPATATVFSFFHH